MACTITQADLAPAFQDPPVDPAVAAFFIAQATIIVLGPAGACQTANELAWRNCCLDPCEAIKLVAQHLLSVLPDTGATNKDVTSERVGDVAVTYGSASSSSGLWAGSIYGSMFSFVLGQYESCQDQRRTFPQAVGPAGGCGCA